MRVLWLIDGSYIYKAMKTFQKKETQFAQKGIDYKKLKEKLCSEFGIDSMDGWYFNSTPDPATDEQNAYHRWLKSAEPKGPNIRVKLYDLKKKTHYCTACGKSIETRVQKGVDVGVATTALKLFERYDAIILSAGDGDFEDFIRFIVEDKDKQLYIVGFNGSISPDIQQYSSKLYALDEHYSEICIDRNLKPFDTVDEVDDDIENNEQTCC